MSECDDCGEPLTDRDKNSAGHYRDRCLECIRESVDVTPHWRSCQDPDCYVCETYHLE